MKKCENHLKANKKYFCKPDSLSIATTRDQIKRTLLEEGPMIVDMWLFRDFDVYRRGIYQHVSTEAPYSAHVLLLIGWGIEHDYGVNKETVAYWIV